jgi:hypothetical protein
MLVRKVFKAPSGDEDGISQEIARLQILIETLTFVLHEVTKQSHENRARMGDLGRGAVIDYNKCLVSHKLFQRYTERLQHLLAMRGQMNGFS